MGRKSAKKPLLTAYMKKKRIEWAKEQTNWTVNECQRVILSDESKFNRIGPGGNHRVRRKSGERFRFDCVTRTVKHSPYIMVGKCITAYGLGPLKCLQGTVDATKYKIIPENETIPAIKDLTQNVDFPLFHDDSAACL
jgi:hypothetical protein